MTDSNLYSICGFSTWQLDLIDPEWAGERLPVEEILVLASSSTIELQNNALLVNFFNHLR
jgi:hypothetical protein